MNTTFDMYKIRALAAINIVYTIIIKGRDAGLDEMVGMETVPYLCPDFHRPAGDRTYTSFKNQRE
jgi:hypothetical protein